MDSAIGLAWAAAITIDFFAEPNGRPIMIGIAFNEQQTTTPLPYEQWDVPMDMVVTDLTTQQFTR